MFEKIKQLSKDTVVYGVSNIVGRFFNFLLVPFYSQYFLTSEFGEFSLVYAYLSFLNILFIYGMDAAFLKYKSVAGADEDKQTVFSTGMITVFISTAVFSVILFLIKDSFRELVKIDISMESIIIYVIVILFLDTLALIPFANLRLENRPLKFAVIKTGNILINLTFNIILIVGFNFGIEAIFISNLIASAFSLIILMPEIVSKLQLKISLPVLRKMLKFALPYLPGSLAAMIVQVIDVPIIEMLTNKSTLGIYRMSYKIGILIMLFVSMFNYAWQPFFLNNAKEKDAKEIFSKVFTIFLILLSLLWIVLSLFVEDVISFKVASGYSILHEKYWEGMFIIPIILLAYLFYGMYVIFTAGIYIEEKTKYFPIVTLAAAAVNVIVNFLLVPKIGIMGGALATLLSYIVMSGGLFIVSQKFYPIKYEMDKVWKILSLVFIVAFIYYYCYYEGFLNLGIKIILFAGFTALFFVLKIISIKEFQTVLKKLKRKGI